MDGTDLTSSTVFVTGATSGIGLATARELVHRVARLVVHGPQPPDEVAALLADLRDRLPPVAELAYLQADYTRLADVARLAADVEAATDRLDIVVNNAALPGAPVWTTTADGHERTLQVDYLAPVALTSLLLPRLAAQGRARIVNVASATHLSADLDLDDLDLRRGYTPAGAYARSKLALVTYTCWLAGRVPPGVEVVSVHPGVIDTDLLHAMFSIGGEPPARAARTLVGVVGRAGDNGTYYDEDLPAAPNPIAQDPAVQRRLHELTEQLLSRTTTLR